jgi:hypothetical protein
LPQTPIDFLFIFCSPKGWGVAPNPSYFFVLIQKSNQKKSRLQIILGLLFFGLPTQYNSRAADAAHSDSIAYIMPPQQASKQSLYPKII